jgi:hypothetical protein
MTDEPDYSMRKTIVRHVRLTAHEDALFAGFCQDAGITVSEGFRRLARSASLLGPTFSGEARAEVVALTRQVRAIGVNLNQAVQHMNAGHVVRGEDVREWLGDAYKAIVELDALYRSLCSRSRRRAIEAVEAPAP